MRKPKPPHCSAWCSWLHRFHVINPPHTEAAAYIGSRPNHVWWDDSTHGDLEVFSYILRASGSGTHFRSAVTHTCFVLSVKGCLSLVSPDLQSNKFCSISSSAPRWARCVRTCICECIISHGSVQFSHTHRAADESSHAVCVWHGENEAQNRGMIPKITPIIINQQAGESGWKMTQIVSIVRYM